MLLCCLVFAADNLLHLPGMSELYLNHARPQWWQFVTHAFCHGSWQHLSGNLFNLCVFGKMVEESEGSMGVVLAFLICGVGAALATFFLTPALVSGRVTVSVGASGAIFGLFAVAVVTRLRLNLKQLLEAAVLGQFVVRQVLEEAKHQVTGGLVLNGMAVSHAAHLAGAAVGVALVLALRQLPDTAAGAGGGGAAPQTLVFVGDGSICPLLGSSRRGALDLGSSLELYEKFSDGARRRFQPIGDISNPVFVKSTGSVFFLGGHAVYRLDDDNTVELVAGHPTEDGQLDGVGPAARLTHPTLLCANSAGSLYCVYSGADTGTNILVAKLDLPAAWLAGTVGDAAWRGEEAEPGEQGMRVSTLPYTAPSDIAGLAWVPWGGPDGSLVVATDTALYRLPLGEGDGAVGVLLALRDGQEGSADGWGEAVHLTSICGLTADGEENVIVVDVFRSDAADICQVASDVRLEEAYINAPAILPNGNLALCNSGGMSVAVLDLGLKPRPLLPSAPLAPAGGPPHRSLQADMGALLDAQPDGTADLIIMVGDRFHAHRAILSARSDYFKQRLVPGHFVDGAAAEVNLPDADPDDFGVLLRYLYTGAADMPASLAPSVAELADRLLLPQLCLDAQAVVLSSICAETVISSLLWAERFGGSFSGLLSDLKAWYLEHHEEVHTAAPKSLERLAASPGLMAELLMQVLEEAKHQVTGGLVLNGMAVSHAAHLAGAAVGVALVLALRQLPDTAAGAGGGGAA
ncbi:hypothetical protein HYH03_012943 [Edaphochlamys debaryana]|uniref:BTB domain-containing protein n=1 Tax=Edaphochlamys debaryana TaxID=47281 RepID=A0A835XUC6_9CHLO|nr:hypothetical protein HYH03_012943 [Edaphochlamys debaryana]|eukprot:KAG2488436.1 hypothetical protein HYH03_012943 [Edaphochlamys debaryana]